MPDQTRTVRAAPHPKLTYVISENGDMLHMPAGWACLKPGDAAVTRELKSLGPCWTVVEKKGRRTFSRGVWAPVEHIETAQKNVTKKRAAPAYAKRRESDLKRRAHKQEAYEESFHTTVLHWLDFHPRHADLAEKLAEAITRHAAPVGSGTVARTERIPIEQRAAAATIAWMRHQTTAYDHLRIERTKGRRRDVRRELAQRSVELLNGYRKGGAVASSTCPLANALR